MKLRSQSWPSQGAPDRVLPLHVRGQLAEIEPNLHGRMRIYPCDVILDNKIEIPRVAIVDVDEWEGDWGSNFDDRNRQELIAASQIKRVTESKWRMPKRLSEALFTAGETGMGYTLFMAEFSSGSTKCFIGGNSINFIDCPDGLSPSGITSVRPHQGRYNPDILGLPSFVWCPVTKL